MMKTRVLFTIVVGTMSLGCFGTAYSSSDVIDWAAGPEHRGAEPRPLDRYLLVLGRGQPLAGAQPVNRHCLQATSFLPAPIPDLRMFFLIRDQVHVASSPNQAPALLQGSDPSLRVTRLLAFARMTSPLEVLVSARPDGASLDQIWLITVGGGVILGARRAPKDNPLLSERAFFASYDAPRCLPGGEQCLVPSFDGQSSYLDLQPRRGEAPRTLQKLGDVVVTDAAWASGEGRNIYLLVPCSKS